MKKIKVFWMFLAVFALLFTSCSKEEEAGVEKEGMATLSFTTVLNNLVSNNKSLKQQLDIPACSDDTPVYVAVVLTGETNVGSEDDPVIVSVNPNPDNFDDDPEEEYFTDESSDLQLIPGEYTLEYFAVYNGDPAEDGTEVIWVAPREDGALAHFVDTSLPFSFDIGPGAKKYVDVEVLCFDDRMVNEYGYLFFDLETTRAIEFCVFGNYCDSNGRHFPAAFSISVWKYDGTRGDIIHEAIANSVSQNEDGDYSAEPICLALPDTEGEDEYWVEITLLSSDEYNVEESVIRSGVLTDTKVRSLFSGENSVEYYHFREGDCDSADVPQLFDDNGQEPPVEPDGDSDSDGIADEDDNCPEVANEDQADMDGDMIGDVCDPDRDGDGVNNEEDNCPDHAAETDVDKDGCEDEITEPVTDTDGDTIPDTEDNCINTPNQDQSDIDGDNIGDACDPDIDGDGVLNDADGCPTVNPTTDEDNDGCEDPVSAPCTISEPATGCTVGYFEGVDELVKVTANVPMDLEVDDDFVGTITTTIDANGNLQVGSEMTAQGGYLFSAVEVWVSSNNSGAEIHSRCLTFDPQAGVFLAEFGDIDASYPYYVRVKANVCPANE